MNNVYIETRKMLKAMEDQRMSREELARKAGVSERYVRGVFDGSVIPPESALVKLRDALGINSSKGKHKLPVLNVEYIDKYLRDNAISATVFSKSLGYGPKWYGAVQRSGHNRIYRTCVDRIESVYKLDRRHFLAYDPDAPEPIVTPDAAPQHGTDENNITELVSIIRGIDWKLSRIMQELGVAEK